MWRLWGCILLALPNFLAARNPGEFVTHEESLAEEREVMEKLAKGHCDKYPQVEFTDHSVDTFFLTCNTRDIDNNCILHATCEKVQGMYAPTLCDLRGGCIRITNLDGELECTDGEHSCEVQKCDDGKLSTALRETDIDCGGDICVPRCKNGKKCIEDSDCQKKHMCETPGSSAKGLATGICRPIPTCTDGKWSPSLGETDVDCGGDECPPCKDGDTCKIARDCEERRCVDTPPDSTSMSVASKEQKLLAELGINGSCQPESCTDQAHSARLDETDVDCGGGKCPACADEEQCLVDTDCRSYNCNEDKSVTAQFDKDDADHNHKYHVCDPPDCFNGYFDPASKDGETDVDCGGNCKKKCSFYDKAGHSSCLEDTDCEEGQFCKSPAGGDDQKLQGKGQGEYSHGFVLDSPSAKYGSCTPESCHDNLLSSLYLYETDIDCGGPMDKNGNFFCAKRCEVGQTCRDNEDCVTNICSAVDSVCAEPSKLPLVLKRVFVDMVVENIW
jgi:hypothetical protein